MKTKVELHPQTLFTQMASIAANIAWAESGYKTDHSIKNATSITIHKDGATEIELDTDHESGIEQVILEE